jgi:hypothetical protein
MFSYYCIDLFLPLVYKLQLVPFLEPPGVLVCVVAVRLEAHLLTPENLMTSSHILESSSPPRTTPRDAEVGAGFEPPLPMLSDS